MRLAESSLRKKSSPTSDVTDPKMEKLYRVREKVAILTCSDPEYIPIFIRIEREIKLAEAMRLEMDDPIAKARLIAAAFLERELAGIPGMPDSCYETELGGLGL